MVPSIHQEAIYNYVKTGDGNLVVHAGAGSGKTTTAVQALKFIPANKKTIFLAFNKSIANELARRVPSHVKVSTMHSLGWQALLKKYSKPLEADKVYLAIEDISEDWDDLPPERVAYFNRIAKLVDLMRLCLKTTLDEANLLCDKYDIDNYDGEAERALEVFNVVSKDREVFDFVDMIYVPVVEKLRLQQYDWVIIDEVQDLSELQHELVKASINPNRGRFFAIGDPNQSIYSFLGADTESYKKMLSYPNTVELPLTVSYRCAKNIIRYAQQIVPAIQFHDDKPEGEVVMNGSVKNIKEGDMVLCRINSPLVQLCLEFIRDGKKAHIKGGDIGKALINFIKTYENKSMDYMMDRLESKLAKLCLKMKLKFPNRELDSIKQVQSFREKLKAISAIADTVDTPREVIAKINTLFLDENLPGITLSTIHKAKGLESKNVFIIEPKLIPFPYFLNSEWQITEEKNLDYVARTRAIEKLEYVVDWTSE
jgi:DNA helicase-2/ATP-dependent DNA helicase PcrA